MKSLCLLAAFVGSVMSCGAEEVKWTHWAEEGEDATSSHHYYFQSNGEGIERVRWVWNGGAQNEPSITEYVIDGGKITVRTLTAKRSHLKALVAGKDAPMSTKTEYAITTADTSKMLLQTSGKALTPGQRTDLYNLISLLARERKPMSAKK